MYQFRAYTEQDLIEMCDPVSGALEGLMLDYKDALFLDSANSTKYKNDKKSLAKHVSSFANAEGGAIILGVQDNPRILQGIHESDLPNDETIHRILADNISVSIKGIQVQKVSIHQQKTDHFVLIIEVPMSFDAPHMLNSEHRYYRRIGPESKAMEHQMVLEVMNRALIPDMDIKITSEYHMKSDELILSPQIVNNGKVTAKFVYCRFSFSGDYKKNRISSWEITTRGCGYGSNERDNLLIYPSVPEKTGKMILKRCLPMVEVGSPIYLKFDLMGENFAMKTIYFQYSEENDSLERISNIPSNTRVKWWLQ